ALLGNIDDEWPVVRSRQSNFDAPVLAAVAGGVVGDDRSVFRALLGRELILGDPTAEGNGDVERGKQSPLHGVLRTSASMKCASCTGGPLPFLLSFGPIAFDGCLTAFASLPVACKDPACPGRSADTSSDF